MRSAIPIIAALSATLPSAAFANLTVSAEQLNEADIDLMKVEIEEVEATLDNGSPLERAGAATTNNSFQFQTTEEDSRIALAVNIEIDKFRPENVEGDIFRISALDLAINASGSIDGDTDSSSLFSSGSIVSGSIVGLALHRTVSYQRINETVIRITEEDRYQCVIVEASKWAIENGNVAAEIQFRQDLQALFDQDRSTRTQWVVRNLNNENEDNRSMSVPTALASRLQESCGGDGQVIVAIQSDRAGTLFEFSTANRLQTFMGLDASLGEQTFDSLDRDAFETNTLNRTSWEVGAYYGFVGPGLDWSLRARALYGVGYTAPEEAEVCRMPDMSTDLECLSGPDGLPIRNETGLAQVELRKFFDINDDTTIGVAPQVTYDIDEDEFDIDVPIYLATDDKGNLSGGLRLGYSTRDDDFVVGLFVGVPFNINF